MTEREWQPTACILCECNCGIEVELGGDQGRDLVRIRGDRKHPSSRGYACEKPQRLNYYQHSEDRIKTPLRRRPDGTFEAIDWDTAISEVAARLAKVRDEHGGDTIFYYGGGGQGNHLPGAYSSATRRALKSRYRSSALAQEKTGEFWISDRMLGSATRADFEHCEVGLFIGKNPWFSHSIQRARVVLKDIAKDPDRKLIVIDPRRTKTAALADIHLQVRPGADAWLLSALLAVLVEDNGIDEGFLARHAVGLQDVVAALGTIPIADYCDRAGVPEAQVREAAGVLGRASSVASMEDLGVQMNRHSTLVSYLHRLLSALTGNIGKSGSHYIPTPLVSIASGKSRRVSPVVGARIVGGMVPCNVIAEEILTDHPQRYRAMIVEAANPAHSLADSKQFRQAMEALDTVVVIDVVMSETAMLADYILPTSTQFEKAEATFFNFEFPENYFHLRRRLMNPPAGVLAEAEIHARLVEALGQLTAAELAPLHAAAASGMSEYAAAFMGLVLPNPRLMAVAPVVLYRTLGPTLPAELREGAVLFGAAFQFAMAHGDSLTRAGFEGSPGDQVAGLFRACLEQSSGFIFAVDRWEDVLRRISTPDGKVQLALPDMLAELATLRDEDPRVRVDGFPFVLSAGERRGFTANTIIRNPSWRTKDEAGALRISPFDADALGVTSGDRVDVVTKRDRVAVVIEVSDTMQHGHVSLPNGLGLTYPHRDGGENDVRTGVAPNELTAAEDRDPFVGTPWHKFVRARVEKAATA